MSSLTNFALLVMGARALDTASFGALAIAFSVYTIVLGVTRALASEPLTVRYGAATLTDARRAAPAALAVACATGIAGGVVTASAGVLIGGEVGDALLVLAALLAGLMVQDTVRYVLMTESRPRAACANDSLWLALEIGFLVTFEGHGLAGVLAAWGLAGCVAAAVGCVQAAAVPAAGAMRSWLAEHRDLWPRFAAEFITITGGLQVAIFAVGLVAGLDAVAALRGGQVLLGPLNVMFLAIPLVAVPESARLWRAGRGTPRRHGLVLSATLGCAAAGWGGVVAVLPASIGRELLGASWTAARSVLLPLTVVMIAMGASLGAFCALRVLAAARSSLAVRLTVAPLVVAATVIGGAVAGAPGAAWGWAAASVAATFVWYRHVPRDEHDSLPALPAEVARSAL